MSGDFPRFRDFPVPLASVTDLTNELHPTPEPNPFTHDVFRPMLAEEIGYTIIGRDAAAFILGAFLVVLVGLALGSQRFRASTLAGWLGPGAAVIAALFFVSLGVRSRSAVPLTVGVAGIVDPIPGTGEVTISGTFAVYHPTSGPIALGTQDGAILGLDTEGLDGQMQRRLQTDANSWHWDGLSAPAGVRTGSFRTSKKATVLATARFGPAGVDGKLDAGPFKEPTDLIVATHSREPLAVRIEIGWLVSLRFRGCAAGGAVPERHAADRPPTAAADCVPATPHRAKAPTSRRARSAPGLDRPIGVAVHS